MKKKDFTPVIEKALELGGYDADQDITGINGGTFCYDRIWTWNRT